MSDINEQFTGKYETSGAIGRWLIDSFFRSARILLQPRLEVGNNLLEIGCGPGYSTMRIRQWHSVSNLIAGDPEPTLLRRASLNNPDTLLICESVYGLPHPDNAFDVIIMLEVLEHLSDPPRALEELRRVSRNYVLLSTPREPLWRVLNMARGKYLGALGNTPGHIQHWSTRSLRRHVEPWFDLVACASPIPWTILLLRPRT